MKRSSLGKVARSASANRRGEHRAIVTHQVSSLLLEIDLDRGLGSLRMRRTSHTNKSQNRSDEAVHVLPYIRQADLKEILNSLA